MFLKKNNVIFSFLFFFLLIGSVHATTATMVVVDTAMADPLIYKRFFALAAQAGFEIFYKELSYIIDTPLEIIDLEKYDIALFLIDDSMAAALQDSPLSQKIITLIKRFSQQSGKISALFLPGFGGFAYKKLKNAHPVTLYQPLFSLFGLSVDPMGTFQIDAYRSRQVIDFSGIEYKRKTEQLLKNPSEWLGGYATSLMPAPEKRGFLMHVQGDTLGFFIPLAQRDHKLFLGNVRMASYASITENFRIAPLDLAVQSKIDEDIWHGFLKLHESLFQLRGVEQKENGEVKKLNYSVLEGAGNMQEKKYENKVLAWMDIEIFKDDKLTIEQDRLIAAIIQGNFDGLWLSIAPNQYFSVRAKFANRRDNLGKAIKNFSSQLLIALNKVHKKVPEIFISFEITNNFVDKNKYPNRCMSDLYGNEYKDVPEPLDRHWWRDEVILSAERFMPFWKSYTQELDVAGFFLDLEMYLRNETGAGEFVSTALGTSVHEKFFIKKASLADKNKVVIELMQTKQGASYQAFLMKEAEKLGAWIKTSLQKIIPGCRVACYAATVSLDWFYQGFYRGLSSDAEPLWLCSFNSRFSWFSAASAEKKIPIHYFSALMLSQIQSNKDFDLVSTLLSRNDGIWLNKLDRMAHEYRPQEWYKLEQTPLSFADRSHFLDVVAKK